MSIGRVACPALLFRGDPEADSILSAEQAESLRALIPQLRIVHIPGASHDIRRDRFDAYLAALRGFLDDTAR